MSNTEFSVYYIIYLKDGHELYFDKDHYLEASKSVEDALRYDGLQQGSTLLQVKNQRSLFTVKTENILFTEHIKHDTES